MTAMCLLSVSHSPECSSFSFILLFISLFTYSLYYLRLFWTGSCPTCIEPVIVYLLSAGITCTTVRHADNQWLWELRHRTSIYHPSDIQKTGKKEWKITRNSRKVFPLETAQLLHSRSHGTCDHLHKTCIRSSQLKCQPWKREGFTRSHPELRSYQQLVAVWGRRLTFLQECSYWQVLHAFIDNLILMCLWTELTWPSGLRWIKMEDTKMGGRCDRESWGGLRGGVDMIKIPRSSKNKR